MAPDEERARGSGSSRKERSGAGSQDVLAAMECDLLANPVRPPIVGRPNDPALAARVDAPSTGPIDAVEPPDPLASFVAAIARGDETALREVYDRTSPRAYGLALRILRDADAAEEAVADVYGQVWRQAARYDLAKGSVATWIATLARTRAIDLRRARSRRSERESALPGVDEERLREPSPGPSERTQDSERSHVVRAALARLPLEQRRAVEASFLDGLSHTEVARALDLPLGTIKTRIRSGLAALRRSLASWEGSAAS